MTPNGPKRLQNYAKRLQSGPTMQQTTLKPPQKALHPPYNPTQCIFQAFPRHEYPSGTLRGPSKATQCPSGPLLHAVGGPKKALAVPKKALWAFFGPSKATIVLNSRPKRVKIGQNENGSKCCPNCLKHSQKGSKGVKTA